MESPKTSSVANSFKSAIGDLTLSAEVTVPLPAPSESPNSCPSFSLGPVKIPLGTCTQPGPISPPSPSDLAGIGSSDWQLTTEGQVP